MIRFLSCGPFPKGNRKQQYAPPVICEREQIIAGQNAPPETVATPMRHQFLGCCDTRQGTSWSRFHLKLLFRMNGLAPGTRTPRVEDPVKNALHCSQYRKPGVKSAPGWWTGRFIWPEHAGPTSQDSPAPPFRAVLFTDAGKRTRCKVYIRS